MIVQEHTHPACQPEFIPSPEEIAAACLEIQRSWSPQERRARARGDCHGVRNGSPEERPNRRMLVPVARDWNIRAA